MLAAATAELSTEVAARQGLEAVVQGKEQLVEQVHMQSSPQLDIQDMSDSLLVFFRTLQGTISALEGQLDKSREAFDELSAGNAELQETCHNTEMAKGVLEQQLGEAGRRLEVEATRAASREAELSTRYEQAERASESREAGLESRIMEAEARLDDVRLESNAMAEQIGELKQAVASEQMAQQQLRTEHAGVLVRWQAAFNGERSAKQQVEERCAAEVAAAVGQVRAETLARQQAEGAATCASVMESLINGVENTVKIKQFMEQLVRNHANMSGETPFHSFFSLSWLHCSS